MADLDDDLGFEPAQAPVPVAASAPTPVDDDLGFEPVAAPVAADPAPVAAKPAAEEPSFLAQAWEGIKGIPEAGQTLVENVLSPLGVRTPVAAAEAALPYVYDKGKELLGGAPAPTFGEQIDIANKAIDQRAEKYAPTATVGRIAGDIGATVATGGLGAEAALGSNAVKQLASTTTKLLGPKVAGVVGGASALLAEGALQGAEQAAATAIDKTIQKGDWQNLGEKLYSTVPASALEGAKWNAVIGGAVKGLGLLGKRASKADEALALQVDNAAAPTTQTANVYDPSMPLRSSEIIDAGTPEAIAARKLTTPEVAKELQEETVGRLETNLNRRNELKVKLEENLRKAVKKNHIKGFTDEWQGGSFSDVLAENGISRETLEDLARKDPANTGKVNRLLKRWDIIESELPTGQGTASGLQLQAPAPGQRVRPVVPDTFEAAGDYRKSLESALAAKPSTSGTRPTVGQMYNALDQFKADVQGLVSRDRRGLVHETLKGPSESLRFYLENPTKVPAQLAEGQKAVNGALSPYIDAQIQREEVANIFNSGRIKAGKTLQGDLGGDPYDAPEVANPDRLRGLLKGLGLTDELAEESLKVEGRQGLESYAQRLRWTGGDSALQADVAEFAKLNHAIEMDLNRVGLANRYAAENAGKEVGSLGAASVGAIAGAAAGSAFGPLGGGVGALAAGAAAKKGADVYKAWRVTKNAETSGAALGLKRAAVAAQKRLDRSVQIQRLLDAAANTVETVGKPLNLEEIQRNVTKEIERIDSMQDPESDEAKKTLSRVDEIRLHGGEELAQAYASQLDRRNTFLFDRAGLPPSTGVFGTEKRELDEDTAATLHRYMQAADDPVSALERMGSGLATAEDGEVLQALFPSMLSEWKTRVVDDLAQSKKKLTYDQQQMLSATLGVGLTRDSDAASLAFWQGLSSAPEQPSQGGSNRQFKGQTDAYASKGDRVAG